MAEIQLTQGKVALVDESDLELLRTKKWHLLRGRRLYAQHSFGVSGGMRSVLMHRFLMDAQPGQVVDHINRNTLDNRRCNLRLADLTQNAANRKAHGKSRFVGVAPARRAWRAMIAPRGDSIFLGIWATEELAAAAYNVAARKFFGEFAAINDVPALPPGAWSEMMTRKRESLNKFTLELMMLERA